MPTADADTVSLMSDLCAYIRTNLETPLTLTAARPTSRDEPRTSSTGVQACCRGEPETIRRRVPARLPEKQTQERVTT